MLSVDIYAGKPAAKSRVRMIPPDDHLRPCGNVSTEATEPHRILQDSPTGLLQHVHHLRLEYMVHRLDRDCRSRLWHGEDVDDLYCVLVHELPEHETHDFHWYTGATVFQHLSNCEMI